MPKSNSISRQSQASKAKGWGFWLWLVSLFLLVLIVAVFVTAWSVRHVSKGGVRFSEAQSHILIAIADFPMLVHTAVQEVRSMLKGEPLPLLMDRKATEQPEWMRHFPEPEDTGYLLFSGVNAATKRADVQLIKISDGTVVARWQPDWLAIMAQTTSKKFAKLGSPYNAKAVNPVLLADGDIIFSHIDSMERMSLCRSKPVWLLDELMHHSNELDENSTGIWSPSISQDGFADNQWLQERVRDDALAHVSTDGRLIERLSFVRILRENGLQSMLMGTSGFVLNEDPIHLNEIKAASRDSRYWKRGDLLVSARNLSTLFLYRPSTNKIIWYQTGPWMNQHSVDFVDDHRISVLNNNVVSGPNIFKEGMFVNSRDTNQVMVYDFDTGQISQPFAALLAQARPRSNTEGRARLLPDGGLFLEETNQGRQLRFTKDRLLWSRVNDYDDKRIGAVAWSRYLTAEEASIPLRALAKHKCSAEK